MSLENKNKMEALTTTEEKLNFAEKLVFGYDNTEIDLSVGMHVIKTEANNQNPQAEFLMYKVTIQKGKIRAAMDWLSKSYNQGHPKALALTYLEFIRGNARFIKEKEAEKNLQCALDANVSEAYFLKGWVLRDYEGKDEEAQVYYEKANQLGFSEESFAAFNYDNEYKRISMLDFRGYFQRYILSDLFLKHIDYMFYHINQGTENDYLNELWQDMIANAGKLPNAYPTEFNTQIFNDNKQKNRYYMLISMPDLPKSAGENLAIYFAISFGSKATDEVRYFLAETDYTIMQLRNPYFYNNGTRGLCIAEIAYITPQNRLNAEKYCEAFSERDYGLHKTYCPLYKPQDDSIQYTEAELFMHTVISICNNERKGFLKKIFKI